MRLCEPDTFGIAFIFLFSFLLKQRKCQKMFSELSKTVFKKDGKRYEKSKTRECENNTKHWIYEEG